MEGKGLSCFDLKRELVLQAFLYAKYTVKSRSDCLRFITDTDISKKGQCYDKRKFQGRLINNIYIVINLAP